MEKKKWIKQGMDFFFDDIPKVSNTLPIGVYELNHNPKTGFYLTRTSDDFLLPEKVYAVESDLIKRMITTFKAVDKNFGVLLQGLKGTGKTVTAKIVCNELKIPVILVNKAYANMGTFINSIDQDIVMFFDEFEKVYEFYSYHDDDESDLEGEGGGKKPSVSGLLTLMDGVFTSEKKRLFLLTTNKKYLPDPMLSRPSRIRYIKEFTDLGYEHIMEILNDSVTNKKLIPGLIKILSELEIITVDIVKAVAEEANIYDTDEPDFFNIFNIKTKNTYYDVFLNDDDIPVEERMDMDLPKWRRGKSLSLGGNYYRIEKTFLDAEPKYFEVKNTGKKDAKTEKITFKVHKVRHANLEMVL